VLLTKREQEALGVTSAGLSGVDKEIIEVDGDIKGFEFTLSRWPSSRRASGCHGRS
jgi:hypothetical protein